MRHLREPLRNSLATLFDDSRISFDKTERSLYGHDIASIPKLVQPIIGNTTPAAVVQPINEEELVQLVRWAQENNVPLVARGKATSGYGGVLPVKGGIIIDLYHMRNVLDIDAEQETATVQPGISWEQLDQQLLKQGLTLRLYPTSYPSSTVGGWLAQGGAGIGSYQFGYFKENVLKAKVVLPDGEVREFAGDELDLISDAEGITGIITQITLRIQQNKPLIIRAFATKQPEVLQTFIRELNHAELPIWSIQYINPHMAQVKNQSPRMEHFGEAAESDVQIPEQYIALFEYRTEHAEAIEKVLPELVKKHHIESLSDEVAQHEWENRFKIMKFKRLGPSMVPAEVIVPLDRLAEFFVKLEQTIRHPVLIEGVIVATGRDGKPEAIVLGFVLADERKFLYNIAFGLTLLAAEVAKSTGGRVYSTGLYFAGKANEVLGEERTNRIRSFKRQIDPRSLFNPRKVTHSALVARFIDLAGFFTPIVQAVCNRIPIEIGERFDHERNPTRYGIELGAEEDKVRGIPADVAWYAYACSQCGYCVNECDQFYGRGWESQSPRGKWFWLREYMEGNAKWNQKMIDSMLACTTCELCNHRCSAALPIEPSWMKLRGSLINEKKEMTFPPFEMMAAALEAEGDIWAGYREDRANWFPDDLKEKHGPGTQAKAVYFAGCTASYVENDIGIATVRLLNEAKVDFAYLGQGEQCCGTPMLACGKWDLFEKIMKDNIKAVKRAGADTVISSCPACDLMWRQYYPEWAKKRGIDYGITAKHYSEVISEKLESGEFSFPEGNQGTQRVTWHDSCHMGRASGVYDAPRTFIKAIPNTELVEMEHNREHAHCCGSVLSLIAEPPVAKEIGKSRIDEALEAGAEKILSLCPCCEFQFRTTAEKTQQHIEIQDLAHFGAERFGYKLPDPNPEVRRQWAVFEKMIDLMTPQGFAEIMRDMFPQMLNAMPLGMGGAMRTLGKIPGALNTIQPMFPVLFPRLLPRIMPKLMPELIEQIKQRLDMPDYMAEQMPDLMPKVMDQLMPHMVGDIVPLVSRDLVNYLHGRHEAA